MPKVVTPTNFPLDPLILYLWVQNWVQIKKPLSHNVKAVCCTPNRIRTCDLRFRKPVLYPAELWRRLKAIC